jgi:hypothetical protein
MAGHVVWRGDKINAYIISFGKPKEKKLLGRLDVSGRNVVKLILCKQGMCYWSIFI